MIFDVARLGLNLARLFDCPNDLQILLHENGSSPATLHLTPRWFPRSSDIVKIAADYTYLPNLSSSLPHPANSNSRLSPPFWSSLLLQHAQAPAGSSGFRRRQILGTTDPFDCLCPHTDWGSL